MYTTIQTVREKAGFQNYRVDAPLIATGNSTIWYTGSKDIEKFVPRQDDGATSAVLADVTAKNDGLSVGISAIDSVTGNITFTTGYAVGSSMQATFASSPKTNSQVFKYIQEANSILNTALAQWYTLPIGSCVPMLNTYEAKIAVANLLIDSYGVSGQDSAEDGYRLMEEMNAILTEIRNGNIFLVDDSGNEVPQDSVASGGNAGGGSGVRVKGYLFTTQQEEFTVTKPSELTD